ncbi:Adenylate cyclase type 9 [Portunus trituberculatus]|uniref:adenylate cyclase n=1 Tax=Portunus trituberculatus TaxID=210409 RepID=A0A5B7G0P1_PORTR|nr:Adenylate cyclase type 9 [Portunus trituberculatus]
MELGIFSKKTRKANSRETGEGSCRLEPSSMPLNESLTRFHQLRKESDIQLIKCIQKDTNHRHIVASPLSPATLFFVDKELERQYRQQAHKPRQDAPLTLASTHFNTYFDILTMKNQADWLLHNIIPRHVVDSIKTTAKYSENHRDVAIMFASIVNFNELYDEDYLGGKEYLRVLNELVADLDELLSRPEFKNIEKIKTIGSTYMAASGLDAKVRLNNTDAHQHIFELVEFALATQKVIDDFNQDLIEFNLIVRIGLNFGDVTAGIIGTTKLYYDIWGDAVNIASRMDSTGVPGRIQNSYKLEFKI